MFKFYNISSSIFWNHDFLCIISAIVINTLNELQSSSYYKGLEAGQIPVLY